MYDKFETGNVRFEENARYDVQSELSSAGATAEPSRSTPVPPVEQTPTMDVSDFKYFIF